MAAINDQLMTPAQLRGHLAISKPTYLALVRDGMPVVKVNARLWRFDIKAVRAWLDERGQKDE